MKNFNTDLLSDGAIKTLEQERFGRAHFIKATAAMIVSQCSKVNRKKKEEVRNVEENLVIGLYGEWGYGKSSVINILDSEIQEKGFKTAHFNPWMYETKDQLIVDLFKTIVQNSGLKDLVDRNKAIELLEKLKPMMGLNKYGKAGNDTLINFLENEEPNAFYCKQELNKFFLNTANPLIIFIDDIDRLDRYELQALFKTVRLLADFEHVVYVLAFDFEMVAQSIKENYADGRIEDGKAFIEKIVQVPLRIPEITSDKLVAFAKHLLKEVDPEAKIDTVGSKLIEFYYKTSRDIVRFINAYKFSYYMFQEEIGSSALINMELIRLKAHDLFQAMKIYYKAMSSADPDDYFVRKQKQYYELHAKDYLREDGSFNNSNILFSKGQEFFKDMTGCLSFSSVKFQIGNNKVSLSRYENMTQANGKTFRNPNIVKRYMVAFDEGSKEVA